MNRVVRQYLTSDARPALYPTNLRKAGEHNCKDNLLNTLLTTFVILLRFSAAISGAQRPKTHEFESLRGRAIISGNLLIINTLRKLLDGISQKHGFEPCFESKHSKSMVSKAKNPSLEIGMMDFDKI